MFKFLLIIILLWFQFGADLFERYQFNKCAEGKQSVGLGYKPFLILPGNFVFLNIMIGDGCK